MTKTSLNANKPAIAVLLAAHNAETTLQQAVDSVLNSEIPVDLFVIDDGSRKPVEDYLTPHKHLHIVRLPRNLGLIGALNIGLDHILPQGYAYVARMDSDDICRPQRFQRQLRYMEDHQDIAVVGSWADFVDEHTLQPVFTYKSAVTPAKARNSLRFNSCMPHPCFFMRAEVLRQGPGVRYSPKYLAAEDYELLMRLSQTHNLASLPEVLIDCRLCANGISLQKRQRQLLTRLKVQLVYFQPFNWRSYAGVVKTLILWAMPVKLIRTLKKILR